MSIIQTPMKQLVFFLLVFFCYCSASAKSGNNILGKVSASSGSSYSNVTITLTNNGATSVDMNKAYVIFDSKSPINCVWGDCAWGDFASLSHPQSIDTTSTVSDNGYTIKIALTFPQGPWVKSLLAPGQNIKVEFGINGLVYVEDMQKSLSVVLGNVSI